MLMVKEAAENFMPEGSKVWRPTPKFLLRRDAVRQMSAGWKPGRFLEVGSGTGTMTKTFLDSGFEGVCSDISEKNRSVLRENLADYGTKVEIISDVIDLESETFDFLFAFEVLEHIEDDISNLLSWSEKLKSGGRLLVSVPAHQRKFSREDEFVGHVRRYEKDELIGLLKQARYENVVVINYGFPLGNITGLLSRMLNASGRKRDALTAEERSIASGVERSSIIQKLGIAYNDKLLWPFRIVQRLFFRFDIGDGYVATGIKV
jgi:SAM-dependent methyltransferase